MAKFTTDQPVSKRDLLNSDHEQSIEELTLDNTRWVKVVAFILADMKNLDINEIYEDIS